MQIHGPSVLNPDPADIRVEVNGHDPERPFVTVEFPGGVRFYLDDGDADVLIKVFCQAKDMLAAHRHAVACHAGIGEYVNGTRDRCPADWGSATEMQRCTREAGHSGQHSDAAGYEFGAGGLPVDEDDGGDGDDNREPYCTTCLFTLTAAGVHMYPDGVLMPAHETELGWREPVGRPITTAETRDILAGNSAIAGAMAQAYANTGLPKRVTAARDALQAEVDAAVQARTDGTA